MKATLKSELTSVLAGPVLRCLVVLLLGCLPWQSMAQTRDTYWIAFNRKPAGSYSLSAPQAYLSPRAIARRQRQGIPIDSTDLPVHQPFMDSVQAAGGQVKHRSRWLNGVTVRIPNNDSVVLNRILALSFVGQAVPSGRKGAPSGSRPKGPLAVANAPFDFEGMPAPAAGWRQRTQSIYGAAEAQIRLHKGDYLHGRNYRGQGMRIAVFDAGFAAMPQIALLDSLFLQGRIMDTYDFVDMDSTVYELDGHGTYVMGCLAANQPGVLMGTAPLAEYLLYRSENNVGGSENPVEEDNWVAAAERADSAGADVFNSSLIYTTFDEPAWNHAWSDMDGNTAHMTIASDMAASKGILVVNSAGNYGGGPWYKIGAAADGDSVLAVGAVDTLGQRAGFSSMGPTADGRIKPNVMAVGAGAASCQIPGPGIAYISGTSFSGPLMAGLAACLWQALPQRRAMEILDLLQRCSDRHAQPDTLYGHGIPNLQTAMALAGQAEPPPPSRSGFSLYPNPSPTHQALTLRLDNLPEGWYRLTWQDAKGSIAHQEQPFYGTGAATLLIPISKPQAGTYVVRLEGSSFLGQSLCILLP